MKLLFVFAAFTALYVNVQAFSLPPGLLPRARLEDDEYERVELTHPVHINKVNTILGYESVLKLVFAVDLDDKNSMSRLFPRLKKAYEERRSTDAANGIMEASRSRSKEIPVNSVVASISPDLFASEDLVNSYIRVVNTADIPGFSVLKQTSLQYSQYLDRTWSEKQLQSISKETSDLTFKMENFTLESSEPPSADSGSSDTECPTSEKFEDYIFNDLKNVMDTSCRYRLVPADMVAVDLNRTLQDILASDSLPVNYRFVIPPDNFQLYLNQSMTDCAFTRQRIYVTVNVPLVREDTRWQFYRTFNPRFVFDQQVCYISSPENPSVAMAEATPESLFAFERNSNTKTRIQDRATCKLNGINQLCYVGPGVVKADQRDYDCASAILEKAPVRDMKSRCLFKCVRIGENHQAIPEPKSSTVVMLTNVRRVRAFCPGKAGNYSKNFERLGALKVTLPTCDCYVAADDQVFPMPCTHSANEKVGDDVSTEFQVAYMIPVTWTKNNRYNMLVEENLTFKIKNHKEIIDFEWFKPPVTTPRKDTWGSGWLFDYVE